MACDCVSLVTWGRGSRCSLSARDGGARFLLSAALTHAVRGWQETLKTLPWLKESHGGLVAAHVLKAHGVKTLFTLTGGHIAPILTGSEELGITVIDVRHEATAAFAADAVSRTTGTVGVCAVTAGPGLSNVITAVKKCA